MTCIEMRKRILFFSFIRYVVMLQVFIFAIKFFTEYSCTRSVYSDEGNKMGSMEAKMLKTMAQWIDFSRYLMTS